MEKKIEHSGVSSQFDNRKKEIIFSKGIDCRVQDTAGRFYLDFCLGHGPVILGHSYPEFVVRLREAINQGIMLPSYTSLHEQYLERLFNYTDKSLRAVFLKTASEAITGAFRVAVNCTGKSGIIRCGFLGWHDAQIANTPSWHQPPNFLGRKKFKFTSGFRGVSGKEGVLNWTDLELETLKNLLSENDKYIGAIAIDAYQARFIDSSIFVEAYKMCKKSNIMFIFDETKTAGRVSPLGIADEIGIDADLRIMGKSLANGLPISLLVGDNDLIKLARKLRIGGTFSKEILTVNAALATLDIMEENNGYSRIAKIGNHVSESIQRGIEAAGVNNQIIAEPILNGSMFEILVKIDNTKNKYLRENLKKCFVKHGALILDGHPSFVCLQHEEIDLDHLSDISYKACNDWLKNT